MDLDQEFFLTCFLIPVGLLIIYAFILMRMKKEGYSEDALGNTLFLAFILLIGVVAGIAGFGQLLGNETMHKESIHFTRDYTKVASGIMESGDRIEILFNSDEPVDITVEWSVRSPDDYVKSVFVNATSGETNFKADVNAKYTVYIRGSNDGEGNTTIRVNFIRPRDQSLIIMCCGTGTVCITGSLIFAVWIGKKEKETKSISSIPELIYPIPRIDHTTNSINFPGNSDVPVERVHGFVGTQLSWTLRPYFHSYDNFTRPPAGNFYVAIAEAASNEPYVASALLCSFGFIAFLITLLMFQKSSSHRPVVQKYDVPLRPYRYQPQVPYTDHYQGKRMRMAGEHPVEGPGAQVREERQPGTENDGSRNGKEDRDGEDRMDVKETPEPEE